MEAFVKKIDSIKIPGRFLLAIVIFIFFASEIHSQINITPRTSSKGMKSGGKKDSNKNISSAKKLAKNLNGEFPDVPLTKTMHATAEEYMQAGNTIKIFSDSLPEATAGFKKNMKSARELNKDEMEMQEEMMESLKNYKELYDDLNSGPRSAYVYVPENYSPGGKWGLIVSICPGDKAWLRPDWKKVLSSEKMLFIAPHMAGNGVQTFKRFMLGLDSIATMKEYYNFSDDNVIVEGLSGGGTIAGLTAFARPDLFKGAIVEAMGITLPSVPSDGSIRLTNTSNNLNPLKEEDWDLYRQKGTRWAFVTGENDFNYEAILRDDESWKPSKLQYRIFDVPGMAHTNSSGKDLQKVIQWMKGAKVDGYEPRNLSPEEIKTAQEKFRKEQEKLKEMYERQQGNKP